jgi:transglutaminase-like putative cysteine protease
MGNAHGLSAAEIGTDTLSDKKVTPQVVVTLVLMGVVCVGLRFLARRDVRLGRENTIWRLTYSIECESERPGATLRVAVPRDTQHSRVFRQDLRTVNLRIEPSRRPSSETREVVAVAEEGDESRLTMRFDLALSPRADGPADGEPPAPAPEARSQYLQSTAEIQTDGKPTADTLKRLQAESADRLGLAERLFEYCHTKIAPGEDDGANSAEEALAARVASPLGRARAMAALCRAGGLPARLVTGFEVADGGRVDPHHWVEVLVDGRWVPYDPTRGHSGELPPNFLPVRRGDARILLAHDVSEVEAEYSIVRLPGTPQSLASRGRDPVKILDLTRLPLEMHRVLSLILLMPLGALVTCVFRNIIGIKTSGTFTPTLLALSFVFADWRTGLVILSAVAVFGFVTRNLLDRLRLLMLPRLSVILTLVVCCIVFGVSLLDYLRWTPGVHAVLLPMVILTMIVERFFVTTQQDGFRVAVQLLGGTVLVGFFCYLVLRWETVARLLLTYPEAHFFTVAVLIMIGRYTGYQLLEPWRFRDIIEVER